MKTATLTQKLNKNPHVGAAAVELLAVNLKHGPDAGDEYGAEAGPVLERCCAQFGLPADERTHTRKQQELDDAVSDAIPDLAEKMERALVSARLLSKRN